MKTLMLGSLASLMLLRPPRNDPDFPGKQPGVRLCSAGVNAPVRGGGGGGTNPLLSDGGVVCSTYAGLRDASRSVTAPERLPLHGNCFGVANRKKEQASLGRDEIPFSARPLSPRSTCSVSR